MVILMHKSLQQTVLKVLVLVYPLLIVTVPIELRATDPSKNYTKSIKACKLYTPTQRDALTAANGDLIYNTTLNKPQGYANNAWVDLH